MLRPGINYAEILIKVSHEERLTKEERLAYREMTVEERRVVWFDKCVYKLGRKSHGAIREASGS